MKIALINFSLRCLSRLPLSVSRRMGQGLGWLWWWFGRRSAAVTLENIHLCFPHLGEREQRLLARGSLQETARMALETPAVWLRGNAWREAQVLRWEQPELLEQALVSDRGLMVLIPHLGNWELAGMLVSARRPSTILYREPRLASLDALLRNLRNVGTTDLVPASGKGVMAVLKALKAGGLTIILPDQEPAPQGGIFSPFFGTPAFSMTLIHRLQQKTDAQILFACALPEQGGFVMQLRQPNPAIYSEDEQLAVDTMNQDIEALVLAAPQHYQWEYKRFRKQPPGATRRYPRR